MASSPVYGPYCSKITDIEQQPVPKLRLTPWISVGKLSRVTTGPHLGGAVGEVGSLVVIVASVKVNT